MYSISPVSTPCLTAIMRCARQKHPSSYTMRSTAAGDALCTLFAKPAGVSLSNASPRATPSSNSGGARFVSGRMPRPGSCDIL